MNKDLEIVLAHHSSEVFQDEPDGAHLPDERLALLSEKGEALSQSELHHLNTCGECCEVMASALRVRIEPEMIRQRDRRGLLVGGVTLAAAAGIGLVLLPGDGYQSKGGEPPLEADVVVLAIDAEGRHDLRGGELVESRTQLGFRYGNLAGEFKTVTVLGWDGHNIHWFYPEVASGEPHAIEGGPQARNLRLPFDVKLDAAISGDFEVYSAFDTAPAKLAEAIKTGAVPSSAQKLSFQVKPRE